MRQDIAVGIVIGYRMDGGRGRSWIPGKGKIFLPSMLPRLVLALTMGTANTFPQEYIDRSVMQTVHVYIYSHIRLHDVVPN